MAVPNQQVTRRFIGLSKNKCIPEHLSRSHIISIGLPRARPLVAQRQQQFGQHCCGFAHPSFRPQSSVASAGRPHRIVIRRRLTN